MDDVKGRSDVKLGRSGMVGWVSKKRCRCDELLLLQTINIECYKPISMPREERSFQ
jgi:hypothetical protein